MAVCNRDVLVYEKAEKARIDKRLHEINEQMNKLKQESEQLWKDRSALLDRMIEIVEKSKNK